MALEGWLKLKSPGRLWATLQLPHLDTLDKDSLDPRQQLARRVAAPHTSNPALQTWDRTSLWSLVRIKTVSVLHV